MVSNNFVHFSFSHSILQGISHRPRSSSSSQGQGFMFSNKWSIIKWLQELGKQFRNANDSATNSTPSAPALVFKSYSFIKRKRKQNTIAQDWSQIVKHKWLNTNDWTQITTSWLIGIWLILIIANWWGHWPLPLFRQNHPWKKKKINNNSRCQGENNLYSWQTLQ